MTRIRANIRILHKLAKYILSHPDQRFGQILRNTGLIVDFQKPAKPGEFSPVEWMNHFNEEPDVMLIRMHNTEKEKK